jgi:hypothetical protein
VLLFEPGTGQALEIPCNLASFHEQELSEFKDAALAADFHAKWIRAGGAVPRYHECIGYRKPLFLRGKNTVDNLERLDLDVYWTLAGQLIAKAKALAPAQPLGKIKTDD